MYALVVVLAGFVGGPLSPHDPSRPGLRPPWERCQQPCLLVISPLGPFLDPQLRKNEMTAASRAVVPKQPGGRPSRPKKRAHRSRRVPLAGSERSHGIHSRKCRLAFLT